MSQFGGNGNNSAWSPSPVYSPASMSTPPTVPPRFGQSPDSARNSRWSLSPDSPLSSISSVSPASSWSSNPSPSSGSSFGPTTPTPSLNNFVHGMHSFQSGGELQFYLRQLGGPGSVVNMTDMYHFEYMAQRNRSVPTSALANSNGTGSAYAPTLSRGRGQPPSVGGSRSRTFLPSSPPLLPGYERKTYLVACDLHPRDSSAIGRTGLTSMLPAAPLSGQPGEEITLYQIQQCEICRGLSVEDSNGRSHIIRRH